MSAPTAQTLVRELAQRMGEFALATAAASGGSATKLVDQGLRVHLPHNVDINLNVWVYGAANADTANRGVERRAKSWNYDTATLTLHGPGMPAAMTTGDYELHWRFSRARKLAALNDALGELGMHWYRPILDESLTTADNTWRYTLPSTINWQGVQQVLIQISTDNSLVGYPYQDATPWDPAIEASVAANGTTTWYLRFGAKPPSGRTLRILGAASYTDLVADTDVVPLRNDWAQRALAWLYKWAQHLLVSWEIGAQPAAQTERLLAWNQYILLEARDELMRNAPEAPNARLIVPGVGTGTRKGGMGNDPRWIGALKGGYL